PHLLARSWRRRRRTKKPWWRTQQTAAGIGSSCPCQQRFGLSRRAGDLVRSSQPHELIPDFVTAAHGPCRAAQEISSAAEHCADGGNEIACLPAGAKNRPATTSSRDTTD